MFDVVFETTNAPLMFEHVTTLPADSLILVIIIVWLSDVRNIHIDRDMQILKEISYLTVHMVWQFNCATQTLMLSYLDHATALSDNDSIFLLCIGSCI